MKTLGRLAITLAIAGFAAGCGNEGKQPAKMPEPIPNPQAIVVSPAAAIKFKQALGVMVAHDKANDWNDGFCSATAQLFLEAAKEERQRPFSEALYDAGISHLRCKKTSEARQLFEQVLEKDPRFHRARMQLALQAFADSGERRLDEAIQEMRQAAIADARFKNVEALVNLGMLYIKRNNKTPDNEGPSDLARARRFIQSALAVDDAFMPAFNQLAILHLESAKDGAGRGGKQRTAIHAWKGGKANSQTLELAALVCSQAIRKESGYAPIYNTAGLIQIELGNPSSAVAMFNTARKLDPSFFEAQMNVAALNMQFRGFDQATEAYRAALKVRPGDYDARLGLALALRGRIDDTSTKFEEQVAAVEKELNVAKESARERPETYYNHAILTQEYKAKSGGEVAEKQLNAASVLFDEFIKKAGNAPEFADAVRRARDRKNDIRTIIDFNRQTKVEQRLTEAERRTQAAQAEVKAQEEAEGGGPKK